MHVCLFRIAWWKHESFFTFVRIPVARTRADEWISDILGACISSMRINILSIALILHE